MRYLYRRTPLLASTVLFWSAGVLHSLPSTAAEQGPAGSVLEQPLTPARVEPHAPTPGPAGPPQATTVPRPAAVSPAQHAAEKAAAQTGPAPLGAVATPLPPVVSQPATIAPSFAGLNRQTAANNGFVFIPPDTILGKSPTQVIEATNSAISLLTEAGSVVSTLDLNTFFGASVANTRLFDPKVYYDRNGVNRRVYVVALQRTGNLNTDPTDNVSRLWLAISRSADPNNLTSNWCRYNIDARDETGTTNESWADYPAIGAGVDSFSVALNNFRFTDDTFRFVKLHVFNKNVASNNAVACPSITRFIFTPASAAGDFGLFTIQPVQHYSSPSNGLGATNPAYYLSTRRGSSNEYFVHRIKNVATSPTYTRVTLTSSITYGIPPDSPQPGTALLIDSGDNRVLQAAGIGDTLIGQLTTVCNFTAGTPNESCTLTPRISVGFGASGTLTAALQENTFQGFTDNIFVHHPSIATDFSLRSAATWEFNGPSFALSSAAMVKQVNAFWVGLQTYASGTCADLLVDGGRVRSGDYSGAQLDPSGVGIWLAGEQASLIGGTCQWQTRIVKLNP